MGDETLIPEEPLLDELVIDLRKPVTFATIVYDKLTLREPTAAEWTVWHKLDGVEADIMAVATVAAIPEKAARMIGARDLLIASRYLGRFLR